MTDLKQEYQQLITQLLNNPNTIEIIEGLKWLYGDDAFLKIGSWLCSENETLGAKPVELISQGKHQLVTEEVNMMIVRDCDLI